MTGDPLSRRAFLGRASALGFALGTPWKFSKPRVGVVGAGVAGLCCARTLADLGFDVVVFEARSRVGGRLCTADLFGHGFETGADRFLDDADGALLAGALSQSGLTSRPTNSGWKVVDDAGGTYTDTQLEKGRLELRRALERARSGIDKIAGHTSLRDAVSAASSDALNQVLARTLLWLDLEHPAATPIENLSASTALAPAPGHRRFDQPTTAWMEAMAKGIDVRFQEAVQAVGWDAVSAELDLEGGTEKLDCIVLSLPLGVLKEGTVTLGSGLPASHLRAIEALNVGASEKLFLEFERKFWPEGERQYVYATGSPEGCTLFQTVPETNVLVGHLSASAADDAGRNPEEETVKMATQQLLGLFGDSTRSPKGHHLTRWAIDPYALGARASLGVGHGRKSVRALAEPVAPRVLLCGEHTHADGLGTVAGAYLSGLRAAGQVTRVLGV